jgi:hypothetical protein
VSNARRRRVRVLVEPLGAEPLDLLQLANDSDRHIVMLLHNGCALRPALSAVRLPVAARVLALRLVLGALAGALAYGHLLINRDADYPSHALNHRIANLRAATIAPIRCGAAVSLIGHTGHSDESHCGEVDGWMSPVS